jgi:hypothetical protein
LAASPAALFAEGSRVEFPSHRLLPGRIGRSPHLGGAAVSRPATAWWHQPDRRGEGVKIFVDRDGSTAGTLYLPGIWYFLGDFTANPFTRAVDFVIGRQVELNQPLVPVGTGYIRVSHDGTAEISWTVDGETQTGQFVRLMPAGDPPAAG